MPPVYRRGIGVAEFIHQVDGRADVFEAETFSGQDLLVDDRVQIGEAVGKLELFAIYRNGTEGGLAGRLGWFGQVVFIHGQEPAHIGFFQFEEAAHLAVFGEMHFLMLDAAEDPDEHVEKVHADIGGHAAGLGHIPLPGGEIPAAARSDVGQIDVILGARLGGCDLLLQGNNRFVFTQLQNIVDAPPRFPFNLFQGIDVPGVEHQGLFAYGVRIDAQGKADMGIVKVVGRADADIVDTLVLTLAAQLFGMAIEAFKLGEKSDVVGKAVENAHGIGFIDGSHEPIAGIPNGFHVTRGDVSAGAHQCKVFHNIPFFYIFIHRCLESIPGQA